MLLEEHKEKTKNNSEKVSTKESKVLEKEKEIEMFMQHVENIHNSKNTEIFFEAVSSLRTKLESFEQSTIPKSFNIITQHYIPNYQIQTNSKTVEIEIQFEIKAKYELDIPHISSITSDKDGNVWITDGRKQTQQLQIKEEIQIIKTLETDLGDAEIRCLNKDVYLASSSFRQICYLAADDKLKVLKDLFPCEPFPIHVSDNEIIVGMDCSSVNDKTDIPIIMRLGFNGKIRQLYKNHGRQLLTRDVVLCCTTITDGTICYIDSHYNTGNIGDVVCIDKDGTIQWKYNGNSLINSKTHSFTPIEVLNTESNNLLVSDKKHHALHVLTAQGEILTIFDLTIIGIEDPGVMTIDINGILWIHSKEMNRATLSHVKFSGI
ncbi:uncharacterized protein [Mytilus edulis]|uniref:uncharacterized protein n=1 Tax=Mytilus edulis TaxID=6550 RepID=UPI0039EE30BF